MGIFLAIWCLAGAACWASFDAKYFNHNAFGTLKYLAVQAVLGPLSWLRLLMPKM